MVFGGQEQVKEDCREARGTSFAEATLQDLRYAARQLAAHPTFAVVIILTLALEPQHGWAISERIQQISSDVLLIRQGSLYPALHRLKRRGWIKAKWGTSDNNRRAKYYELTRSGQKQLEAETENWKKLTAAVAQILESM